MDNYQFINEDKLKSIMSSVTALRLQIIQHEEINKQLKNKIEELQYQIRDLRITNINLKEEVDNNYNH
jgi:hypothetical protein